MALYNICHKIKQIYEVNKIQYLISSVLYIVFFWMFI